MVYIGFSDMVRFMPSFVLHLAANAGRAAAAMVAALCRTSCCASQSTLAALAAAPAAYVALARAPVRSAVWRRAGVVLRDLSRSPPAGIASGRIIAHLLLTRAFFIPFSFSAPIHFAFFVSA